MVETLLTPTLFYGPEAWVFSRGERRRVGVYDIKYLRRALKVNAMGIIMNSDAKERCGYGGSLLKRLDEGILMWFEDAERRDDG